MRIAIGIGKENYSGDTITESNGSAYVRSGKQFEELKKLSLAIRSKNSDFDFACNTMLSLAMITANNWSPTVAEIIKTSIENPEKNQQEIANILSKSQSGISEALKRGAFDEIMAINTYFNYKLPTL